MHLLRRKFFRVYLPVTLCTVIALVLALRASNATQFPDERDYIALARNMDSLREFSIDGQHPTAFRQPGWPFLLSLLTPIGSVVLLRCLNVALLFASLMVGARIGRRIAGEVAETAFCWLSLSYLLLPVTASTLFPQMFAGLLLLVSLDLLMSERGSSYGGRALLGFVLGYLVLSVSTFLPLALVVALSGPTPLGSRLRATAVSLVVLFAVVGAWAIRNDCVVNTPTISTNFGYNLLLGNCDGAGPNTGVDAALPPMPGVERLPEAQENRAYEVRAVGWIQEHPERAAQLYVLKLLNYFGTSIDLHTSYNSKSRLAQQLLLAVPYYIILALALLAVSGRNPTAGMSKLRLLALLYLLFGVFSAIFFTRLRFRVPMDLVLLILAAGGSARIYQLRSGRSGPEAQ